MRVVCYNHGFRYEGDILDDTESYIEIEDIKKGRVRLPKGSTIIEYGE